MLEEHESDKSAHEKRNVRFEQLAQKLGIRCDDHTC